MIRSRSWALKAARSRERASASPAHMRSSCQCKCPRALGTGGTDSQLDQYVRPATLSVTRLLRYLVPIVLLVGLVVGSMGRIKVCSGIPSSHQNVVFFGP